MILIPIIALLLGALIGFRFQGAIPTLGGNYMAVACLAGLDTVLGGIRSGYENKFQTDVFVTGFFSNVLIAFFIAWYGDKIFINLYLVVALVMGMRIFNNLSLIRRYVLVRFNDSILKRREKRIADAAQIATLNEVTD